ncbi:amino acid permease [Bacillus safensis]|uniref:amino acid permease n=1 Tax=Bacillus TaxID=1386 RepID=UPI0022703981|nr:amino acid permease [Bacillus safensis]MCY1118100.1 amino acid permease [Bacillus safensis]
MEKEHVHLKRTMTSRHIMMLALGGAIGAGLFKGSSSAIDIAGPAVILAYMIGGLILLFIMQGLAEMTVARPGARTFRDLIEPVLGKYPAYFLDWIYWKMWVLNIAAEAIVSAIFIQYWFPHVPIWTLVLIISLVVTLINVCSVKMFAETEYWLASIKIAVIILFIIIGLTMLFVSFGQHAAPGLSNLTDHGGFFPNGTGGLIAAMLVVVYSYGGTEMIGVTLAETKNPEKVIPKAIQSTFVRIIGFYVLPFFIIVSLIPWNQVNNEQVSPFVTVFATIGVPYASDIMNGIILLAILSSMNSGLYASSRVLYTQAMDGRVWKGFSKLSKQQVPVRAILVCTSTLYAAVLISLFVGSQTFNYLMGSLSYTVLFIWFIIAVGHLKSRSVVEPGGYRVKLYPFTTWFSVIAIIAIFIGVVSTTPIAQTMVTMGIYLIITLSFFINRKRFETAV